MKKILYLFIFSAVSFLIFNITIEDNGCSSIDNISKILKMDFPSNVKIEFCKKNRGMTSNYTCLKVKMDTVDWLHFLNQRHFELLYTSKNEKNIFYNFKLEYDEWNPESVQCSIFGMFLNEQDHLVLKYMFDISKLHSMCTCISNTEGLLFPDDLNRCLNEGDIFDKKALEIVCYFCIID